MRFVLIRGEGFSTICAACGGYAFGGTLAFRTATGNFVKPDRVYSLEGTDLTYHEACAAKLAQDDDPTRSRTQFFSNTDGTILEDP